MDSREHPLAFGQSGQPQNMYLNPNSDDPLLDIARLFSGASLAWVPFYSFDLPTVPGPSSRQLVITDLDDDCDLALFDQLPLQKQLPLRAVCPQWNALIEQKCLRKRSLMLFETLDDLAWYCYESCAFNLYNHYQFKLKQTGYDDDFIGTFGQLQECAHLFVNIESFVYCGNFARTCGDKLTNLPEMFPSLTSLTTNHWPSSMSVGFINWLQNLTSLHLFDLPESAKCPEKMPILAKLQDFSLCIYWGDNHMSFLSQLGTNVKRLMIFSVKMLLEEWTAFISSNQALVSNITTLLFDSLLEASVEECNTFLDLICNNFPNLTYLCFGLDYLNLQSFESLRKLHQITDLRLMSGWQFSDVIPRYLPTLPSVTKLQLYFPIIPDIPLNFQAIFPNTEQIVVDVYDKGNLKEARQYMAHFSYSCPVSYTVWADNKPYMGRHLKPYLEDKKWRINEFAGLEELFTEVDD